MQTKLKLKAANMSRGRAREERAVREMPKVIAAVDRMGPNLEGMEAHTALTTVAMLAIETILATKETDPDKLDGEAIMRTLLEMTVMGYRAKRAFRDLSDPVHEHELTAIDVMEHQSMDTAIEAMSKACDGLELDSALSVASLFTAMVMTETHKQTGVPMEQIYESMGEAVKLAVNQIESERGTTH